MESSRRFCLIGLGNPGSQYRGTRHNVGFDWVDQAIGLKGFEMDSNGFQEKFEAHWAKATYQGREVHILKPMTYMNLSGQALQKWKKKFQGEFDLLVVFDEMDVELGKMKLKLQGSDAGHKGLRSILEVMGTREIPRLRLGVGRPIADGSDHVLTKFKPEEKKVVDKVFDKAQEHLKLILSEGFLKAMNQINGEDFTTS